MRLARLKVNWQQTRFVDSVIWLASGSRSDNAADGEREAIGSQMNPITFSCEETLPFAPEDIAQQILDLTKWPDFHGYGPIPGIKVAEFDLQTPGIVGSRIRVTNLDGSSHVEEIVEWREHRI